MADLSPVWPPAFRSAEDDYLLQLAGFVAHALLLQEEEGGKGMDTPERSPYLITPSIARLRRATYRGW